MPKTTVTVDSSTRASKKQAPRVTVNTVGAKTQKQTHTEAASTEKAKEASPASKTSNKLTSSMAEIAKGNRDRKLLNVAILLLIVGVLSFYAWKGLTSVSSEAIAARVEKKLSDEQEKNRETGKKYISTTKESLESLEKKIDVGIKGNKDILSRFGKKAEEHEKGMLALVDAVNEIKGQVDQNLTDFRLGSSKENKDFQKQTLDRVESITARIENRLRDREASPPPNDLAPPVGSIQYEGTRAVAASTGKPFKFEGQELRPGEMSHKYCIKDVKAGRIEISNKPGIIARNHLHMWRSGWIDTPVPSSGTYIASPDAKFISFYSLTETFTVKRISI